MDRNRLAALAALALAGAGAWWWSRQRAADAAGDPGMLDLDQLARTLAAWAAPVVEPVRAAVADVQESVVDAVATVMPGAWTPPAAAEPYLATVYAAEDANGIPRNLLARLLYQESRYRADIINGTVKSSAGAVGIAQIVPRWHPDVDPLDPVESINYAAGYLARLRNRFGSWSLALAAYNWGEGNLSAKGIGAAPAETRKYVADITGAVGVA